MLDSALFHKQGLEYTSKPCQQDTLFHKGETVVYDGNTCRVMRVNPFLVIKCGNRVVCGNLYKQIKPVKPYHH